MTFDFFVESKCLDPREMHLQLLLTATRVFRFLMRRSTLARAQQKSALHAQVARTGLR